MSHDHYFIDVSHIDRLDVYRLLDLFKVTCPVAQHIVKKALAAGQRGHKDTRRDWQDIADSAARRLQMIDEDIAITERLTDALGGKAAFGQQSTIDCRTEAEKGFTPPQIFTTESALTREQMEAIKKILGGRKSAAWQA